MGRSIVLQNDTQLCIAMPELSSDEIDSCKCHSASDLGNRAYDYRIRKMPLIFEWISGIFIIYSNLEGLNRLLQRPAIQIFGISRQLPVHRKIPLNLFPLCLLRFQTNNVPRRFVQHSLYVTLINLGMSSVVRNNVMRVRFGIDGL